MDLMAPSEVSKQCRNSVEVRFTELICAKNPTGPVNRQTACLIRALPGRPATWWQVEPFQNRLALSLACRLVGFLCKDWKIRIVSKQRRGAFYGVDLCEKSNRPGQSANGPFVGSIRCRIFCICREGGREGQSIRCRYRTGGSGRHTPSLS